MTLQRLGTDTIRGVTTTHYRILHGQQWNDLWADTADHLLRITSTQTHPASSKTIDFFDYGARFAPITLPTTSISCISRG